MTLSCLSPRLIRVDSNCPRPPRQNPLGERTAEDNQPMEFNFSAGPSEWAWEWRSGTGGVNQPHLPTEASCDMRVAFLDLAQDSP
jgi:hypothetical protein